MARTLIVMVLLLAGFPAKADQCDHIVANLIAQTPGLQFDKRMPAEGAEIVYLKASPSDSHFDLLSGAFRSVIPTPQR